MTIRTFQFSPERLQDIPFEILRFEALPKVAIHPSPRRHAFYEIFWITEGSGLHHLDFEAWEIAKNTLRFVNPGQVNFWDIQQPVRGYVMLFTSEFIATNMFEQITLQSFDFLHYISRQPLLHINEYDVTHFNTICEQMLLEYSSDNYGRFTILQCQLITLLIHAQRGYIKSEHFTSNSVSDKLIFNYRQLIDTHFQDVRNIQDYARMLNVTSGHLRDVTREKLAATPSDLLNKRVILEVKRLLTHSENTVAAIAHHLQFDDPSYFSRFFKRETGLTPSAFRQQIREKYQLSHE